jgi:hypothetical protein
MSETAINVGYSDVNQAPERQDFEPFPAGIYNMQIIEAAIVPTADGTGKRLTYKAEVIDGPQAKKKVFGGINIINKSPEAQKIGQAELGELAKALKMQQMPTDTTQLIYQAFTAKVKIQAARTDKATGKSYDARNEISRFMPYGQTEPAKASGGNGAGGNAAAAAAQSANGGGSGGSQPATGRRPWEQN